MRRSLPEDFEPRAVCSRCSRPRSVCYCAHLTSIETKTRVVLLQHPREEDMAIGTARMASLCLPNSELHVGVDFDFERTPALRRAISDPTHPAALLYPGDDAVDVLARPPSGPITLVVVDGTWWQAKKLVRSNPILASLPRYAFRAPTPSEYRIRREPDEAYVSTIEALAQVLGVLEGDPERLRALLVPFRKMIDVQIEFAKTVRGARVRHGKSKVPTKRSRIPDVFRAHPERLVFVAGEANAWPYRDRTLRTSYREELVHWVAHRPATNETLDVVVRPRNPLAPSTPGHVGLTSDELTGGRPLDELFERWSTFLRDDDVVCVWGPYALGILATEGGRLPRAHVDVRRVSRELGRGRIGTMDAYLERFDLVGALAPVARGRAGKRAAQLVKIGQHLTDLTRAASP